MRCNVSIVIVTSLVLVSYPGAPARAGSDFIPGMIFGFGAKMFLDSMRGGPRFRAPQPHYPQARAPRPEREYAPRYVVQPREYAPRYVAPPHEYAPRYIGQPGAPSVPAKPPAENPADSSVASRATNSGAAGTNSGLIGAAAYVPNFLPPRPPFSLQEEVPSPGRADPPSGGGQIVNPDPVPQASPFDSEVASFDNRVVAAGAPAIDPRMVANALDAVYGSAAVARLEKLPDEGWTREILQTHILRRAEDILPEFSANLAGDAPTRDRTLTQLFDRAALEALPSALTEQEAVAFSASLKRYLQGRAAAGEPAAADAVRVVPISDPNASASAIADAEAMFEKIDAQFPSPELGLRGKLRARRIVLDCLTEADPTRKNVALVASPAVLIDTRPDCVERVRGELSAPGQMTPAPADSIWTQQGPMFHGQKWEIASGRS